jgi:hypothetical protein
MRGHNLRNHNLSFTAALAFAAVSWLSLSSSAELVEPVLPDIQAGQFDSARVIGYLGHPLGTIVRVTGVCTDDTETRRRADSGKTLLKILTANGKPLNEPFFVEFRRAREEVSKPGLGDCFDYYVHEWGTFDGHVDTPKSLGIEEPKIANDGFYYRPEVTVHKANPVQKSAPVKRAAKS